MLPAINVFTYPVFENKKFSLINESANHLNK